MSPLEFVPQPRDRSRSPFPDDSRFRQEWWAYWPASTTAEFYGVEIGGVEVARMQLVEGGYPEEYIGVPPLGSEMLKLQLLEVAVDRRREGLGTRVVECMREVFPDRRFVAFSEGADKFWESVGWDRFEHPNGRGQPLFVQPAG